MKPFPTKIEFQRIFNEAKIGYGFVEISQYPEGIYCTGCGTIHKRPTKMYSNGQDTMCNVAIVHFYNPEE